jgi:hypothetical protein
VLSTETNGSSGDQCLNKKDKRFGNNEYDTCPEACLTACVWAQNTGLAKTMDAVLYSGSEQEHLGLPRMPEYQLVLIQDCQYSGEIVSFHWAGCFYLPSRFWP